MTKEKFLKELGVLSSDLEGAADQLLTDLEDENDSLRAELEDQRSENSALLNELTERRASFDGGVHLKNLNMNQKSILERCVAEEIFPMYDEQRENVVGLFDQ